MSPPWLHGTLDEARRIAKETTEAYEHIDVSNVKKTFADACNAWAASMRDNDTCAPSKLKDYETRLSYVPRSSVRRPWLALRPAILRKRSVGQGGSTPVVCSCTGTFLDPHLISDYLGRKIQYQL